MTFLIIALCAAWLVLVFIDRVWMVPAMERRGVDPAPQARADWRSVSVGPGATVVASVLFGESGVMSWVVTGFAAAGLLTSLFIVIGSAVLIRLADADRPAQQIP